MSGKRVYVMLSLPKDSFVYFCRNGFKIWKIPGYPWQVLCSLESVKKKCRVLNRDESNSSRYVYFYKSLYSYSA